MDPAEVAREHSPTKLDIQVGLIVDTFAENGIGVGVAA